MRMTSLPGDFTKIETPRFLALASTLAGCWAHVYRKFEEAAPDHPEAQLAMQWIGELYVIDKRAET